MTVRSLSLAFVLGLGLCVAACGGSSTSPTPVITGTPVSIVSGASLLTTTAYSPNPLNISTGTTVTWVNNDSTVHTSIADGGSWTSGNINPNGTFTQTFSAAGTFTYHCSIHPGMVGTVTVK